MEFEFDAAKSAVNKDKHGIDFVEAQALWQYPYYLDLDARSDEELRFARIGKIGSRYWVAFYTPRRQAVRIISVRRARKVEIQRYEAHIGEGTR